MKVERVQLGDVLELQRRAVNLDLDRDYIEIGLRSFGRGMFHKDPVRGYELGGKRVFAIEAGDLLVSNIFAWEGAVAVAGNDEEGLVGSHRFMTWTPIDRNIDVDYVRNYLLSDAGMESLRAASPGSAGRNRTLSIKNLEDITVPLLCIERQRKVVQQIRTTSKAVLAMVDSQVDERWLDRLRQQLIGETQPRRCVRLGEVLHRERCWVDVDPDAAYLPIGVKGFGRGLIRYPALAGTDLSKLRYAVLKPGHLVVSNIKAWEGAVAVSCRSDVGRVASNRFLQYAANDDSVSVAYLAQYLLTSSGLAALQNASPGSADRNRTLSMDSFEAITVPIPLRSLQDDRVIAMRRAERVLALSRKRSLIADALVPAARNEVFSRYA